MATDGRGKCSAAVLAMVAACSDDRVSHGGISPTTTGSSTDVPSETGSTTVAGQTAGTTDTSEATGASTQAATTTGADTTAVGSSDASSGAPSSSGESSAVCVGDEAVPHATSATALELGSIDCDDGPLEAAGVLDMPTGPDWWTFSGTDPDGGCEPDSVRIEVSAALPIIVCAFTDGCEATCVEGVADGPTGCCNLDVVELAVSCGRGDGDDSSAIRFVIGSNQQDCFPVTFTYEF